MQKYLVCKKQYGEGCDYTIGCGMRFDFIEADSIQDAIEQTVYPDGRDELSQLEGESALKQILIIHAEYVNKVDVEKLAQEIENERKRQAAEQQKNAELAELERLREKYGNQ